LEVADKQRLTAMAIGKKTGGRDFQPGESGNPNGRPKFSIASIIRDELLEAYGDIPDESLVRSYVRRYVRKAHDEVDGVAIRDLIDRFDGKPKQSLSVENQREADLLEYLRELDNKIYKQATTDIRGVPEEQTKNTDT
jgi:hypothetical protein